MACLTSFTIPADLPLAMTVRDFGWLRADRKLSDSSRRAPLNALANNSSCSRVTGGAVRSSGCDIAPSISMFSQKIPVGGVLNKLLMPSLLYAGDYMSSVITSSSWIPKGRLFDSRTMWSYIRFRAWRPKGESKLLLDRSTPEAARRSPLVKAPKLSRRLATAAAKRRSPPV